MQAYRLGAFDFVVDLDERIQVLHVAHQAPLDDYDRELNALIEKVVEWAEPRVSKSVSANAALAYSRALWQNRVEGEQYGETRESADSNQIVYILSNLTGWRGDVARATKKRLSEIAAAGSRYQ